MLAPARGLLPFVLVLLLVVPVASADVATPTPEWLARHVDVLASPAMEGRRSGTAAGDAAARYLADAFAAYGLRPGGDSGTFLQWFVLATGTRLAQPSVIDVSGPPASRFQAGAAWLPHGGSPDADLTAEVVFVGDDEYAGRDVRGRIVVARGAAQAGGVRRTRLERLVAAHERGAAALLLLEDPPPPLDATPTHVDLPSGSITPAVADALRAHPGAPVRLRVTLAREDRRAANVVGILPGTDPALAGEAVVVGAHYDHVGREGGVVHPGADDNASGTAVVLGLARAFADAGGAPRTLVFALFGAEELGLIGSRHYVTQPVVPIDRTVAMLNFDMVGRLRNERLHVGGVDSGTRLRALVAETAAAEGLALDARGSPYAPSDHARFYAAGTPVLFFFTGRHEDYHRPGDTADKIDARGLARIAAVGGRIVAALAAGGRPTYVAVERPRREAGRAGPSGAALFGVMGDGGQGDGVRISGVVPGSAAARAGLTEGDVIVRFDGTAVSSMEELRGVVQGRKPGQRVSVVYVRDGRARTASDTLDAVP